MATDTTPRTPGLEERIATLGRKIDASLTARVPFVLSYTDATLCRETERALARLAAERDALLGRLERIAGATVHPDTAVIMPASMSHMKVSDFAAWAQQIARAGLNPEGADHA